MQNQSIPFLDDYLINESKFVFNLQYLSELMERKGLKNISRYLKAISYSRQALMMRLYRNLKILNENQEFLTPFIKDYFVKEEFLRNQIDEQCKKENIVGCTQTMYFSKETISKQKNEIEKIVNFIQNNQDKIYNTISVCPLCGLVITEELERCPVCGANKAIFRTF